VALRIDSVGKYPESTPRKDLPQNVLQRTNLHLTSTSVDAIYASERSRTGPCFSGIIADRTVFPGGFLTWRQR
jgi:hypothetical protein